MYKRPLRVQILGLTFTTAYILSVAALRYSGDILMPFLRAVESAAVTVGLPQMPARLAGFLKAVCLPQGPAGQTRWLRKFFRLLIFVIFCMLMNDFS